LSDRQVQSVFLPIPVTVAVKLASLDRSLDFPEVFQSPEGLMFENISYNFFVDFLNNVVDGKVTARTMEKYLFRIFFGFTPDLLMCRFHGTLESINCATN
jgi:hypothetical protein